MIDEGGGAFYGPKISVQVRDAIGRTWQLSTIQLDFQMPQRFDLEYVGADGERHRPVMIHRALFGSVERFFGMLVEHYAGAFPTWLAPVQVRVLPVRDDHDAYAAALVDRLQAEGFRADVVEADEPLGARIRKAKLEKLPYVLVVGDDDVEAGTVGVNPRGGDVERGVTVDDFVDRLRRRGRRPRPTPMTDRARRWTTCGPAGAAPTSTGRSTRRTTPSLEPATRPGRCSSGSWPAACPTTRRSCVLAGPARAPRC